MTAHTSAGRGPALRDDLSLTLLPPPALRECRHRGLARAIRQAPEAVIRPVFA
jgi:hypothetical protein